MCVAPSCGSLGERMQKKDDFCFFGTLALVLAGKPIYTVAVAFLHQY